MVCIDQLSTKAMISDLVHSEMFSMQISADALFCYSVCTVPFVALMLSSSWYVPIPPTTQSTVCLFGCKH